MTDAVQEVISGEGASLSYESGISIGSMLWSLARYAFVTFIVLLVFWAFMHLLRRMLEGSSGMRSRGRIRVVESTRLSGDKLLYIVRVDNREVLIGSFKEGLSHLCDLGTASDEVSDPSELDLEDGRVDGAPRERARLALEAISSMIGRVWSVLVRHSADWINRVKKAVSGAPVKPASKDRPNLREESEILRESARRVEESARQFRDVLRDEVASSTETSGTDGQSSRFAKLRSLAAKSEERDDRE